MTIKITIKFKKPNVVFESGTTAHEDKRALYSDDAKASIINNHTLLHELEVFTAPIQFNWDPETFTLSVHKFIDPEQIAIYWSIHQLIAETTDNQPTNGWTFIDIVETPNYSTT
jgi:hypothetical protein